MLISPRSVYYKSLDDGTAMSLAMLLSGFTAFLYIKIQQEHMLAKEGPTPAEDKEESLAHDEDSDPMQLCAEGKVEWFLARLSPLTARLKATSTDEEGYRLALQQKAAEYLVLAKSGYNISSLYIMEGKHGQQSGMVKLCKAFGSTHAHVLRVLTAFVFAVCEFANVGTDVQFELDALCLLILTCFVAVSGLIQHGTLGWFQLRTYMSVIVTVAAWCLVVVDYVNSSHLTSFIRPAMLYVASPQLVASIRIFFR